MRIYLQVDLRIILFIRALNETRLGRILIHINKCCSIKGLIDLNLPDLNLEPAGQQQEGDEDNPLLDMVVDEPASQNQEVQKELDLQLNLLTPPPPP